MPYNDDLPTALAAASQIDAATLSATTEPTLAQATVLWTRAEARCAIALLRAGLNPTKASISGSALGIVQQAEMFLASGWALLSKSTIVEGQRQSAKDLLLEAWRILGKGADKDGPAVVGQLVDDRTILLSLGASQQLPGADVRVDSRQIRDAAPGFDPTAGKDVPYDKGRFEFETDDAL